ncbi:hypothetical protein [uncultured Microbulbifer sp.]|uniref:hypothetical protein n=1 Tax=uncultured Microbulbifer sp. TaxID=348147 RepID=UPI00260A2700|nr:hypothetical protein [uncultured Microbulbifer sp.]
MDATFVEMPPFARFRSDYLDDDSFQGLQQKLLDNPEAGNEIPGTGGLRKLRFADKRRGKGTRGGIRIIYYWYRKNELFWLFTLFDKDEASDLTPDQKKILKEMLKTEIKARK